MGRCRESRRIEVSNSMAKRPRTPRANKGPRTLAPEDHDFIHQILASPEEDRPRLAYADWLEQQSDRDRAAFIRLQIEAVRLAPPDPRRERLAAQAAALLEAHKPEWEALPPEIRYARVGFFERGFPAWARCMMTDFVVEVAPHLADLWRVAPITRLEFYDLNAVASGSDIDFTESWIPVKNYEALANLPQLVHLRSLSVAECAIKDRHLKALLASPHLINLRELHLSGNRLGAAGARVVAEWPRAAGLTHLDLSESGVGDRGAQALAQSPYLSNLKTLLLQVSRIRAEGARALAHSPHLADLERLDLVSNRIGAAKEALRQRFGERLAL
jgi:uncharacterized protein (TIGR02996 family)